MNVLNHKLVVWSSGLPSLHTHATFFLSIRYSCKQEVPSIEASETPVRAWMPDSDARPPELPVRAPVRILKDAEKEGTQEWRKRETM